MTGAFGYLIVTSARNQVRARIARLRNPRYAIALLLGAAYIWAIYLRPSAHSTPRAQDLFAPSAGSLLPLLPFLFVAWTWIAGADQKALAFSEAEVSLLFTAPVSRRTLVLYRIVRTQLTILTTSIVWTLVFRQTTGWAASLVHIAGYWVMLSTLNLNRLGVALIRAGSATHGLRSARRYWIPIVVFATLVGMLAVPLAGAWPEVRAAAGMSEALDVIGDALQQPLAWWALLPFQLIMAPMSLPPGAEWLAAFATALLLMTGMMVWVLRTDAAFEETAAQASEAQARKLAALRGRRGGATVAPLRNAGWALPLAPTGVPAVALAWKNGMWLIRANQLRGLLLPPIIGALVVLAFSTRSPNAATLVTVVSTAFAVMMLLIGPMSMRNDLRTDLAHVAVIKTFPLRGRDVVLAEVVSSALPLAALELMLALISVTSLSFARMPELTMAIRAGVLGGAPVLILGLACAVFVVHNGFALLLPGWVRIGGASGGVETLGFGMISLGMSLVVTALLLLVPVGVGLIAGLVLRPHLGVAIFVAEIVAGLLLLGETVLCAWALGGSLERVEPMAVEG